MDNYKQFYNLIEDLVKKFKELNKEPIRLISHIDADGLSAASILIRALQREDISFSLSIVKQIDNNLLKELSLENYNCYIFLDIGSGQLSLIENALENKTVFILDHHKPEKTESKFFHINPHICNIDGSKEISGSGVSYLFARALNPENKELAYLAIIGAIADVQEDRGFSYLNNQILEESISQNQIKVITGLRIFGAQTRPLHKVLEYSTDPLIPGVTGSEQNALIFLKDIGIDPKKRNKWKKLIDLSKEDLTKLISAIVIKRVGVFKNPEDVLGPVYLLEDEKEESPTKDLKEFSTLLNSCGRLNQESLGIGTCLGDKRLKKLAINTLVQYRREIVEALEWFFQNRKSEKIIEKPGFTIINAEDRIRDTLIGTISSIISKSNIYKDNTFLLATAYTLDDKIKVSCRISGFKPKNIDLREVLIEITNKFDSTAGGHKFAAGAIIPQDKEEEFLKSAISVLKQRSMEELIE